MGKSVTAEAGCVLDLMLIMADTLPLTWQTEQFCLGAAQALAQVIATHDGKLGDQGVAEIMAAGSVLIAMARAEQEASDTLNGLNGEDRANG